MALPRHAQHVERVSLYGDAVTAAQQEHKHKQRKSIKERRRIFVERYPCPSCMALPGAPCELRRHHEEYQPGDPGPHGDFYHVSRFKKAGGAAIDQLLTIEGVRYDEESAIDECETRKSEPEARPHLQPGFKP